MSDTCNEFVNLLQNASQWNIFIDDVEGELCMDKRKGHGGRSIDVVATEEIEKRKLTN